MELNFAPITGAWIETLLAIHIGHPANSHPSRVRGLKRPALKVPEKLPIPSRVRGLKLRMGLIVDHKAFAPITGAWIETIAGVLTSRSRIFAPITGAWIETSLDIFSTAKVLFAPITGAWIETYECNVR